MTEKTISIQDSEGNITSDDEIYIDIIVEGQGSSIVGKLLYRAMLLTAIASLMILIFGFSGQTGEESGLLSALIAKPLTKIIVTFNADITPLQQEQIYQQIDFIVRKTAHFCEYALLGLLLCLLFRSWGKLSAVPPWICGVLYAVTDEIHQLYVPARTGKVEDVLLDAVGVFCGIMVIRFIIGLRRKC